MIFRNLSIRKKITLPFLALLITITLIGTPLAMDFVSEQIARQAKKQVLTRADTVQSYFDSRINDLKSDVESLGLRGDLTGALESKNVSSADGLLIREAGRHGLDFILVYDTTSGEPRLVASDTPVTDPLFLTKASGAEPTAARFAQLEATYAQVLEVSDAFPKESTDARAHYALVAGAPMKYDGRQVGFVLGGLKLDQKFLYDAVDFTGGIHENEGSGTEYADYFISLYALDPGNEGRVVATSGEFQPTDESGLDAAPSSATQHPAAPADCGSCHGASSATGGSEGITVSGSRLGLKDQVETVSMPDNKEYLVAHKDLVVSGVAQGVFSVLSSTDELSRTQATARNSLLAGTVILVLLITLIGYAIGRAISSPIVELSRSAKDIALGRFDIDLPQAGQNEIGELSNSLATMASTLQENTRTIQSRLEEISLLYAFSSAAGSTLDLQEILQTLLNSTARVLGASTGSVMLVTHSGTELQLMAHLDQHRAMQVGQRTAISEGIAGWVASNRRTLILPRDFTRHPELKNEARGGTISALSLPIETKDSVLGVLNLSSTLEGYEFSEETAQLARALANQAAVAIENAQLFETLRDLHSRVVRALGSAIDAKDRYTQGHSALVARYGAALAASVGLSEKEVQDLEIAGYLHDIGKIGIYDAILQKEGKLTTEERNIIRTHPVIGATIIEPIGFPWDIVAAVRHHHEWWNGNGYPDGLKGRQIPLGARVLAIVDSFEAMTAHRPYKPAMTLEEAWMEVSRMAGIQFDPEMVEHFLSILDTVAATNESLAGVRVT